ncbi:MAG: hypothetical protein GC162_12725 [Planctomycetes bacterium]|nr:hypothetical protein [Planctomycetota bacterium]
MSVQTSQSQSAPASVTNDRLDELTQIIEAYNRVTNNLQQSHDTLTRQVVRLQEQLASANEALQRSRRLAALGEMAAGIAHEVRNPLASIQLYARMLSDDLTDRVPQRDLAERIASAVRGLDRIVGDVLTYARQLRLSTAPVEVAELFGRAIDAVRPMIDAANIRIVTHIDPADLSLECDAEQMHQALVNLVRNAAEATPGSGVIRLAAKREGVSMVLTIADTGPGIDAEDVDRIFNPFFTTRATGTGLGLPIVHRIVDAHGGSIAVHNDPEDQGAVFTLTFPPIAGDVRHG